MNNEEVEKILDTKGNPRVTKKSIEGKIERIEYQRFGIMTICFVTMRNGFISTGVTAPASPDNFDKEIGEHYAYENAFRPLWQLEGYLLREKLAGLAKDA